MFNALIAIMGENFNRINDYYSLICCESEAFFPLAFRIYLLITAINKIFLAVIG